MKILRGCVCKLDMCIDIVSYQRCASIALTPSSVASLGGRMFSSTHTPLDNPFTKLTAAALTEHTT